MTKLKTSIVIPVYNGLEFLKKNLATVLSMEVDEVVIVDDASSDGSTEYIKKNFPKVKLITNIFNQRFPKSVNEGVRNTTGDVVFLLNQDLKPKPGLVEYAVVHFNDQRVFAVTFNEEGRSWADGKWQNGMLEFKNGVIDNKVHDSLWPSGGSCVVRKDLWDKLGGFDEIFTPGYYEDLDLGLRAHKLGLKIIWDPKCRVDHQTEGSFPKAFPPKKLQYIKERNYLLAVWKNIDSKLWPTHVSSLIKRIINGPGYIIPLLWALWTKLAS